MRRQRNGHPMGSMTNVQYLNTYAWLTMLGVAAITVRAYVLANHRLGTSLKLHSRLLKRLLAAPVAFFDVTPIGACVYICMHIYKMYAWVCIRCRSC